MYRGDNHVCEYLVNMFITAHDREWTHRCRLEARSGSVVYYVRVRYTGRQSNKATRQNRQAKEWSRGKAGFGTRGIRSGDKTESAGKRVVRTRTLGQTRISNN